MKLLKSLPLSLVLIITSYTSPSEANLFPRAIRDAHKFAVQQTHSLARDLRVAFGGVLVSRDEPGSTTQPRHVVYCKPKQVVLGLPGEGGGGGGSGGGNGTVVNGGGTSTSTTRPSGSGSTVTRTSTSQGTGPTTTSPPNIPDSPWRLAESYAGDSFFQGWDFFTGDDPTHGIVDYVDEGTARASGLLEVNDLGNAMMRVETTPQVENLRRSIRIQSKLQFNGGLVIIDAIHMPTGCGIWPAFWTNGPNWPHGGEIDIMEGVHDYTNNQATIHTDRGCTIASTDQNVLAISGNVIGGTDCAAETTGNQGCGIRANSGNTFGAGFNRAGGGIYAMKWDSTGIAIYFFPRGSEPADLLADKPQPDSWGPAQARWPAASCDPFKYFNNHHAIFDTTLCGDWAGAVWSTSGIPGQEQSCAERTGFSSCEAFVRARGSTMNEAYWEVKNVKIFQLR